jgi:hypothetical protein
MVLAHLNHEGFIAFEVNRLLVKLRSCRWAEISGAFMTFEDQFS